MIGGATAALAGALLLAAPAARAEDLPPEPRVHLLADSALVLGGVTVGAAAAYLPAGDGWVGRSLLPFDRSVENNFSGPARHASDAGALLVHTGAMALQLHGGGMVQMGRRALILSETLAVTFALTQVVKHSAERSRPFLYNRHSSAVRFAGGEGRDARLSFYSGHAASSFAAAVGGAYLFTQTSTEVAPRAVAWGTGLMLATATADLRVRAGMHFWSDVLVGAGVGSVSGWVIPRLHVRRPRALAAAEWIAIAAGPLAGLALGQLLPVGRELSQPRASEARTAVW